MSEQVIQKLIDLLDYPAALPSYATVRERFNQSIRCCQINQVFFEKKIEREEIGFAL